MKSVHDQLVQALTNAKDEGFKVSAFDDLRLNEYEILRVALEVIRDTHEVIQNPFLHKRSELWINNRVDQVFCILRRNSKVDFDAFYKMCQISLGENQSLLFKRMENRVKHENNDRVLQALKVERNKPIASVDVDMCKHLTDLKRAIYSGKKVVIKHDLLYHLHEEIEKFVLQMIEEIEPKEENPLAEENICTIAGVLPDEALARIWIALSWAENYGNRPDLIAKYNSKCSKMLFPFHKAHGQKILKFFQEQHKSNVDTTKED